MTTEPDHRQEGTVPASVTGPFAEVELPSDTVDFEAELVAAIGRRAHRVGRAEAWGHVAGLTAGQDLSATWSSPARRPSSVGTARPAAPHGPGDQLITALEGVGEMRTTFRARTNPTG